jgi:hypothetical protein
MVRHTADFKKLETATVASFAAQKMLAATATAKTGA